MTRPGAGDKRARDERSAKERLIADQREANAQMVGTVLDARDQTERARAAQQAAEEHRHRLEQVGEVRELFIGILGHDLRNPLASIKTTAELLLERGHLDEHDARSVARIVQSGDRMAKMISQLLDLTRARLGGGLPLQVQPTDLATLCRRVAAEFEAELRLELVGDLAGTWDPDRLAQALSNITGNAVEHAAPGTAVMVRAYPEGAQIVVEVVNQGDPIPEEVRPFLFYPFRRARGLTREPPQTGHLGLGLYIAEQVALGHGGTLDAHSAEGATTFVMRLPRATPPAPSR